MEKDYLNILKTIEKNGFVSYIVGGYVRDLLLSKNTTDIDIITNATPKDLKRIFQNTQSEYLDYGAVKLHVKDHIIDITTFRRELSYKNGKPDEIEYISSLEEDLKRRDFTINTLVMDSDKNIIDLMNAKKDLDNKLIKTVKDVTIELTEDPSRILRALRFMSVLDFDLEEELTHFIINNKELIKEISITKRKEELDKLFKTKKVTKFMNFVKEYNLDEVIGFKVNSFKEVDTVIGVWSQLEIIEEFNFTKYEKEQIKEIKSLLQKHKIDKIDIYQKGPYISSVAAEILGLSKKDIYDVYNNLPIKEMSEINIASEDVCKALNIEPGKLLGDILKQIEKAIVLGNVNNNKEDILKFLTK